MASIIKRAGKGRSVSYRAQIRKKVKGQIVFKETKTFRTKVEAKEWATKVEAELNATGVNNYKSEKKGVKFTVSELIDLYIKEVKPVVNWGRSKDSTLKLIQKHDIANIPAFYLKASDVIAHCKKRISEDDVKPQTVSSEFSYLKEIYAGAQPLMNIDLDDEEFQVAKIWLKKHGHIGKSAHRARRPEEDEITAIVSLANSYRKSKYFQRNNFAQMDKIIVFAMFSTRRLDEICRIKWDDLDRENKEIIVRDMKDPRNKKGNDVVVSIPDEAFAVIDSMSRISPDGRIFPYNSKSISTNFSRLRAKAGYEKKEREENLKFHDLRHEGISWLFEKNGYQGETWDIPKVARVSGHKNWQSLSIYENRKGTETRDRWENWEWKTKVLS